MGCFRHRVCSAFSKTSVSRKCIEDRALIIGVAISQKALVTLSLVLYYITLYNTTELFCDGVFYL